jgi:uncharacterized protein YcbX
MYKDFGCNESYNRNMEGTMGTVSALWTYPFKGARGRRLRLMDIDSAVGVVNDRRYALRRNSEEPKGVEWAKKNNFFVAMNTPAMAAETPLYLNGDFSAECNYQIRPRWVTRLGKRMGITSPVEPHLLDTQGTFNLTDTRHWPTVSILNKESVEFLRRNIGIDIDPLRFRMNVIVSDLKPFEELSWVPAYPGSAHIRIGDLDFQVMDACERCLAINANPETGKRDLDVLQYLTRMMRERGYKSPHRGVPAVMGILAKPLSSGRIPVGAPITLVS